jgi:putative FmdB family regulatory protein
MPLYEYHCPECDRRFEVLQRMGEGGDALRCPSCGAGGVERQLSTFAAGASSEPVGAAATGNCACGLGPGMGCGRG